jgi:hypothetical protein
LYAPGPGGNNYFLLFSFIESICNGYIYYLPNPKLYNFPSKLFLKGVTKVGDKFLLIVLFLSIIEIIETEELDFLKSTVS